MKKMIMFCFLLITSIKGFTQINLDQNGLKTIVTNTLKSDIQAMRYEIVAIGFNSYHWQYGGSIIIELFHQYYGSGYDKYLVDISHGVPNVSLIESNGVLHTAKITMGVAVDLNTSMGDMINKVLPVYLDLKSYAGYKVKITYMQEKVEEINDYNQIKVNIAPTGEIIPDFFVSTILSSNLYSSGNLMLSGNGPHYLENGNLGIGTTTPQEKLSVNGKIRAKEVKVETTNWPDYVFKTDYFLPSLAETEKHIKEKGYLPGMPSAKEVESNGLELGEIIKLQQQKIEELLLLLIDQNKRLIRLENKKVN